MALNAAAHHSAAKVVAGEMDSGLRAQTTVSAGSRPAALKELELLVGGLGAPRCPGSDAPSLALAVLGGGGDGVDASCLAFLVRRAVKDKKEEEEEKAKEEEKMRALSYRIRHNLPLTVAEKEAWLHWMGIVPGSSSSSSGKRRKRKLPKSSSRSSSRHGRPCDHQRRVPEEVRFHGASDSVHRRCLDSLVVQRQVRGFLVRKTVVVPQLQFIVGRQHPLLAANADPHGPVCSADHGDSTVAAYFGGRCPCCAGSCRFSGAAVEKTLALPQLQLFEKSVTFYVSMYLAVTCSVFAFGVQASGLFLVMTSGNVPVFSAELVQHWIHVCVWRLWKIFTFFLRQGGPRIPKSLFSLSVVLVLVCLCADTPIWARIAFSLSLVGAGAHCRLRLRRRGQGLRSWSPWFGARVHSCRGAERAPLVCLFS